MGTVSRKQLSLPTVGGVAGVVWAAAGNPVGWVMLALAAVLAGVYVYGVYEHR